MEHDPCYHRPCDILTNINLNIFTDFARAAAYTSHHFVTNEILFENKVKIEKVNIPSEYFKFDESFY